MHPWFTAPPFLNWIDCAPKFCYHEVRFEKDSRYYVLRLSQDLLEDWVITLINGRIKSKLGQSRTLAFASFNEAFEYLCALAKIRFLRGYQPKTITIDNHLMVHILPFMIHAGHKNDEPSITITKNKKSAPLLRKIASPIVSQQLGFAF